VGTVTSDIEGAVRNAKAGQVRYRVDKGGVIHTPIGRADFGADALAENLDALIVDLQKIKPATSKGKYMKKVTVSTTMGPGVPVDLGSLSI
jgi:large subunit ribosomal protein L1